jgi:hypothetical protein
MRFVRDGSSAEGLVKRELLAVVTFMEDVLFQMRIRREVDRRERDVTEQASTRASIQAEDAERADDVNSTPRGRAFQSCCFTLDLKPNLAKDRR